MAKLILLTNSPIEICLNELTQLNLLSSDFDVLTGANNNANYFTKDGKFCCDKSLHARLKHLADVNVFDGQDLRSELVPARFESGVLTFEGFASIAGYERVNGTLYFDYNFKAGVTNFVQLLPEYTDELDLGTHRNTAANVQAIFQDDRPYEGLNDNPVWYSLKNYGEGLEPAIPFLGDVSVPAEYMRPDIHAAAIIDAIELATKKRIKSNYFKTRYFRNQIHPSVTNLTFVYSELGISSPLVRPTTATDLEFLDSSKWDTIEDPYSANTGGSNVFGINFPNTLTDDFTVNVIGTIELTSANPVKINFFLKPVNANGPIINAKTYTLTPGLNPIDWSFDGEVDTEWFAFTNSGIAHTFGTQTNIKTIVSTGKVLSGIKIFNNSILRREKTNDYINAISDFANLVWVWDEANDCVIVEPRYDVTLPTGEFVKGFYKNFSNTSSVEIDCENESGSFNRFQVNRNLYLRFKDDDNDKRTNETTYQHYELLSNKYPDEDTEQTNEVFAATVLGIMPKNVDPNNIPRVPLFQNYERGDADADKTPFYDYCNRILYKHGNVRGSWVYEGSQSLNYPFAAQNALGVNLGFGDATDEAGDLAKGIATTFYQKDFDIYNFGIVKTIEGIINPLQLIDRVSLFRNAQSFINQYGSGGYILEEIRVGVGEDRKDYKCEVVVISLNSV